MEKCIIFCAAEFDGLAAPLGPGDYLMAADGGAAHLKKLGLQPHGIIGDFDSQIGRASCRERVLFLV